MPTTRRQTAEARRVGVTLTLDDTARKLTRVSGSVHSIANLMKDTVAARPGFRAQFEKSGSTSSAYAREIWRFHDRRWKGETGADEDDDDDDEDDRGPIDDEVDRRLGEPFSLRRAVEVAIAYLNEAREVVEDRKREMVAWSDEDGAQFMETFVERYKTEIERWSAIQRRLMTCMTTLGESHLDTSLRYGWIGL